MTITTRPSRRARPAPPGPRRLATALLAGALVVAPTAGAVAGTSTAGTTAANATAATSTVDPFDLAGGFSVYARQDATLANQETEGSIAVGGELTVTRSGGGTYAIHHYVAGTPDYTIPTVDGDPTRLLVGSFSTGSGLVEIKNAGSGGDPSLAGYLKVAHDSADFAAHERAGWVRWRTATDDAPAIDATNQTWPDGEGSVRTERTDVASYVEAGATPVATVQECLATLASPTGTGHAVGVAESYGGRVVLEPLAADVPNVVAYDDVAGAELLQLSAGSAAPGTTNPLVIRVPAGTTDVTGLRMDPQGVYSPYVLWDLSAITGSVSLTSPVRIDGSVYAPDADLTVSAAPLDGQVVARNLVLAGEGEAHAFLFAGRLPCGDPAPEPVPSGFTITKVVSGDGSGAVPEGTAFTVAQSQDGTAAGTVTVTAGATTAVDGLAVGTVVTLTEVELPEIDGVAWGDPSWSGTGVTVDADGVASLVVGATTAELTLTNVATTEPTDPTDPTDPTEPTDPTDPTDPTEPTEPTEPGEPADPAAPGAPPAAVPASPAGGADDSATPDAVQQGSSSQLATTGASAVGPVAAALGLLLTGTAALLVRRRLVRRRTH